MNLLQKIWFAQSPTAQKLSAEKAYDKIAEMYDDDKRSLLQYLDAKLLQELLQDIEIEGKILADIGCGTGRHWPLLLQKNPGQLNGFDVSAKMIEKLQAKHFPAKVYMQNAYNLQPLQNSSCNIIISTLTIGYIKDPALAFAEWNRVLKSGGEIIMTDYHPEILLKGGNRKFKIKGDSIEAESFIHSIEKLENLANKNGWQTVKFIEKNIDESVKKFYEEQNALPVYKKFFGTPLIYGLHLK